MGHTGSSYHFHRRKRIYQKHEPYPHPDKLVRTMDTLIYVVIFGSLAMTIPQVMTIWINKNAAGVSFATWSAYFVASCFWLVYGIVHKEKPLIVSNIFWIMLQGAVALGVLVYG